MLRIKLNHSVIEGRARGGAPRSDVTAFRSVIYCKADNLFSGDTYRRFTVLITRILIRPGDIFCFQRWPASEPAERALLDLHTADLNLIIMKGRLKLQSSTE